MNEFENIINKAWGERDQVSAKSDQSILAGATLSCVNCAGCVYHSITVAVVLRGTD